MTRFRSHSRNTNPHGHPAPVGRPVLVVEDQRALSLLLKGMLEDRWGCEVHVANSFAQAKTLLSADPPYMVALCDLNLPDAAHGEIIDAVQSAGVPAIVLTGAFGDELRDAILKKGVVDYVLKDNINAFNYVCELVGRLAKNRSIKVLAVDDSLATRALLKQSLEMYGLQVLLASNGREGLRMLQQHRDIRVMLVDYYMPEMDGFALTIEARKLHGKDRLAIIGISGSDEPSFSARFLKNGANDFIHKPFHYEEVICRVNQNLEMLELIEISQRAANCDFLTGLSNRRHFFAEGQKRCDESLAAEAWVGVAMIDIDHFKAVNDTYGHDCGDAVLRALARVLEEGFEDHLVARLGGEEFVILIQKHDEKQTRNLLENLRKTIQSGEIPWEDKTLSITVSIGTATSTHQDLDTLLRLADERLYQAKALGRNQVVG
jgi:diguanylate cyclase (GGDEF)-like protein